MILQLARLFEQWEQLLCTSARQTTAERLGRQFSSTISPPAQLPRLPRAPTFFAALFMLQKTSVSVYGQGERFWQTVVFHSSA